MSLLLLLTNIPAPPAGTYAITNHSGTSVFHAGAGVHQITKTLVSGGWDSDAVSSVGMTGDFALRFKGLTFTDPWMAGVNSDPLTDSSYTSLDYAMQSFDTTWQIWESNTSVGGAFAASGYGWIWRVGTTLGYGVGPDFATAQASPQRTVSGVTSTLYFDSSILGTGTQIEVLLYDLASSIAYSLTAATGVFNLTGSTANLPVSSDFAAAAGAFSYSSSGPNLTRGYLATDAVGSFGYSGAAANLIAGTAMTATGGTFSYSGNAVSLARGYSMPAVAGAFSYTGNAANLSSGKVLSVTVGAFTYSGNAAALSANLGLAGATGVFAFTGAAAGLSSGYRIATTVGVFTYNGFAAGYGLGTAVPSGVGSFSYAGNSAGAALSASLSSATGTFACSGNAARALLNLALLPPTGGIVSGPRVSAFFYRP